ncbi:MAG: chitobiase/beta-hexosaminidase C-terminal domain-containing protein [Granulicella sp.]
MQNYVHTAEAALYSASYTDPVNGWRPYFDEAAAVNFCLVNDIMGNVDGGSFFSSVYLYKNNPLLYMGPVWDFDISSGNVNYQPIVNATVPWMYAGAITIGQSQTVRAIAIATNYNNSAVTIATYSIAASAPVFSLASGSYPVGQTLTITDSTPGAAIYYTVDGAMPTAGSTLYSRPVTIGQSQTVRAIAVAANYSNSTVTSATYVFSPGFTMVDCSCFADDLSRTISYLHGHDQPDLRIQSDGQFFLLEIARRTNVFLLACNRDPCRGAVSYTVAIATKTTASNKDRNPVPWIGWPVGVAAALLVRPFRRRRVWLLIVLGVLDALSLGISGCGDQQFVADGVTSVVVSISVVATGGGIMQTGVVSLTQ